MPRIPDDYDSRLRTLLASLPDEPPVSDPENAEVITSNVIASTGCGCDDTVHGFYESGNLNPIIAFHGFRNVSKIAEQYDKRLKQLRENQNRIETDNIYSATGLDDVASEKAKRAAEYGAAGAVGSVEDLF